MADLALPLFVQKGLDPAIYISRKALLLPSVLLSVYLLMWTANSGFTLSVEAETKI